MNSFSPQSMNSSIQRGQKSKRGNALVVNLLAATCRQIKCGTAYQHLQDMGSEEFDEFGQKLGQFVESMGIESYQPEQLPEIMAATTAFSFQEGDFQEALEMVRQSVKNLSVDPNFKIFKFIFIKAQSFLFEIYSKYDVWTYLTCSL